MKGIELSFNLEFGTRHDEVAGVYVGWCPLLDVYSQADTKEQAEEAVVDATQAYIVTCYELDTLHKVLRKQGLTRASAPPADVDKQFISIHGFEDFKDQFEREFSVDLLVAQSKGQDLACVR